ncbi:hypothetical protein GO986_16310 [Deinococcus sp. HMF7620]|uniref:Uncharacterized protein n=1 Tax=Deinococcus arboris TaxID=2682977 RepID=A0A7C9I0C7_9DEIO|nr:hypothetical protein [Deinococcus arboris]MVN88310.1 hypothetical protein [Deinococcus arboris]
MTTQITYAHDYRDPDPQTEALRQVFSAVSLVRDRLHEVELEYPWTPTQVTVMSEADELLREAHRILGRVRTLG